MCKSVLKTLGGSTKGLYTQLSSKHGSKTLPSTSTGPFTCGSNSQSQSVAVPSTSTKRKIDDFNKPIEKDTLDEVLSRMTAPDVLLFNVFITSQNLRKLLHSKDYTDLRNSNNSIRNQVINYSKKIRNQVSLKIRVSKIW